ncbi:MAG: hypothetical protein LCH54_05315 [Bacteroidetes bacterium]|nr:hypothetical protein [Bacteroidota bacterium]
MVLRFILIFLGSMLVAACEFNFEEETLSKRVDETRYYYYVNVGIDRSEKRMDEVIISFTINQHFRYQTDRVQEKSYLFFQFLPSQSTKIINSYYRNISQELGYASGSFLINYSDNGSDQDSVKLVVGDSFHQDSLWIVFPRVTTIEMPIPEINLLRIDTTEFEGKKRIIGRFFADTKKKTKLLYFFDNLGYSTDQLSYMFYYYSRNYFLEKGYFSFNLRNSFTNIIHFSNDLENGFSGIYPFIKLDIFGVKYFKKDFIENSIKNNFIIGGVRLTMGGDFSK